MDILGLVIVIVICFALIAYFMKYSGSGKKHDQFEQSSDRKDAPFCIPYSSEYNNRISAANSLAKATVCIVNQQKKMNASEYLYRTDVSAADTVFLSCFVLRAICITSTNNRTAAEQFSNCYISKVIELTKSEILKEDIVHDMFDNRTRFYDQIIMKKGGLSEGLPSLMEEFDLIIQTDMIEKKYVPFSSSSPLPVIDIFDAMQCRMDINSFFTMLLEKTQYDIKKAMDSIK